MGGDKKSGAKLDIEHAGLSVLRQRHGGGVGRSRLIRCHDVLMTSFARSYARVRHPVQFLRKCTLTGKNLQISSALDNVQN